MLKSSNKWRLLVLVLVLLVGLATIVTLSVSIDRSIKESRRLKLEKVNSRANIEFSRSLDRFVFFVSGIKSYLKYVEEFPTEEELFEFVQLRRKSLNYHEDLIISFIDTSHVFRYSFDDVQINPAGLVGLNVANFRDSVSMLRIDRVLDDEEYHLFAPANLVEGWVGVPLHFSIERKGTTIGYVAAIVNIRSIIDPIYDAESSGEVLFDFSADQLTFDREQVHDGSKVHHSREDPLFFRNFDVDQNQFIYSHFDLHKLNFRIGTAFLESDPLNGRLHLLLYGWYIFIGVFVIYAIYGFNRFSTLNGHLARSLETIKKQKKQIDLRNEELNHLNETKDKFFSVLSHDMRSPISSISSLVDLLRTDKTEENDMLLQNLRITTDRTLALLENILQWSLVNTKTIKLTPVHIDCKAFVEEILSQFKGIAYTKQIQLEHHVEDGLQLFGDKNIISTILRNLISNAIKVSPEKSKVRVEAEASSAMVVLRTLDNGPGLSEDSYLELTNIKTRKSTGLGLILVQEFTEMHGGTIKVSLVDPIGTKFELSIPSMT